MSGLGLQATVSAQSSGVGTVSGIRTEIYLQMVHDLVGSCKTHPARSELCTQVSCVKDKVV